MKYKQINHYQHLHYLHLDFSSSLPNSRFCDRSIQKPLHVLPSWNSFAPLMSDMVDSGCSPASVMFWIIFFPGQLTSFLVDSFLLYHSFRIFKSAIHRLCSYHLSWASMVMVRILFMPSSCLKSSFLILFWQMTPLINQRTLICTYSDLCPHLCY